MVSSEISGTRSMISEKEEEMEERIKEWLDGHPEFATDYYSRKSLEMVCEEVLAQDVKYLSTSAPTSFQRKISPNTGPPITFHRSNSGVPLSRALSEYAFDNQNRIVKNQGGVPTFVRSESHIPRTKTTRQKSIEHLKRMRSVDEDALFIELVEDIASDLDVMSLSHKILQNVSILTNADRCSLFLVQKNANERPVLTSKVFDCNADSTLDDMKDNKELIVPWGTGIVGHVAETGEEVNLQDAYNDTRFNTVVDKISDYKTKSLLCLPVKLYQHDGTVQIVGVAQALNKINDEGQVTTFSESDRKVFEKYLAFCAIRISNAQLFENLDMEMKRNEILLDVAQIIFEEQINLKDVVFKILLNTHTLIECQRLSLLLLDKKKTDANINFWKVFDFESSDFAKEDNDDAANDVSDSPRFPINVGVTTHVATTGETLNISDAYQDCRFDPSVESTSEFITKTVLCMPVWNSRREIIGVVQLVNKANDKHFSSNDENLFEAFAIYCGMAINNTSIFEKCKKSFMRQKIAIEMLSYHATASQNDVAKLSNEYIPTAKSLGLCEFSFDDIMLSDDETALGAIGMFCDLGLVDTFRIDHKILCSWVLTVRKNYRPVVYHNWRHAFNVTQNMFLMLSRVTHFQEQMTHEEKLGLIIACLCHDIDHRGLTNDFQVVTASPLAKLYGTSVMERHHLDHCIRILNSNGNDLLRTLSVDEYNTVVQVIEEAILATDLAIVFKDHKQYFAILKEKSFNWSFPKHRRLLRGLLMSASDLAAMAKPWLTQKRVAHMIAEEFYQQGDLEHRSLHVKPQVLRDRAKVYKFPEQQVGFLDFVCLPIYRPLVEQYPELAVQLDYVTDNRKHWKEQAECAHEFLEQGPCGHCG